MAASAAKYKVSFGVRPQARDDNFIDQQMTAVIGEGETLDVLANDLGGNAKTLAWVGYADTAMFSQLGSDVSIADNMVSYVLTDATITKVQKSTKGSIVEDTFTYKIQLGDGTFSTATATVYIEAVNHDANIVDASSDGKDDFKGEVTEDFNATAGGLLTARGSLMVNDFDVGDAKFQAFFPNLPPSIGAFTISESGEWSYSVRNDDASVQALGDGDSFTERFDVMSADGTASKQVEITVHGKNDAATFSGTFTGNVAEGGNATANGTLSVADVDTGQASYLLKTGSSLAGTYGNFTLAEGAWAYTLDETKSALNTLDTGVTGTDSFTVQSVDGTEQTVTVDIAGMNEKASLTRSHFGFETDLGMWTGSAGGFIRQGSDGGRAYGDKSLNAGFLTTDGGSRERAVAVYSDLVAKGETVKTSAASMNGAATLSTMIDVEKGQTIQFKYKFRELGEEVNFDEYLLLYVNDQLVQAMSDVTMKKNAEYSTTFQTFSYQATANMESAKLEIVGMRIGNGAVSQYYIDNLSIG